MKTEFPMFTGQRETICYKKKISRDRPWIFFLVFCCSSNMLIRWFHLYRLMSGVRPPFGAHPKVGAATFNYLHVVLDSVHLCLYLFTSQSQLTFKPELSPYLCLVSERGHIHFQWFYACAEDLGPPGFFSSHF